MADAVRVQHMSMRDSWSPDDTLGRYIGGCRCGSTCSGSPADFWKGLGSREDVCQRPDTGSQLRRARRCRVYVITSLELRSGLRHQAHAAGTAEVNISSSTPRPCRLCRRQTMLKNKTSEMAAAVLGKVVCLVRDVNEADPTAIGRTVIKVCRI